MNIKLRTIYIDDIQYLNVPSFEFNPETQMFHMIGNDVKKYAPWAIVEDSNWIVFELRKDADEDGHIFHHVKQIPSYLIYNYDFVVGEL